MTEYYEQHPIPQQISAYQFRLVGDMTLKQFFQVAAGALIAILIYSSGLAPYIKWPLIIFSFLFGVALAFFPLEDRPLSKWIVLFFKAIYSPTIYIWKKSTPKLSYFLPEPQLAEITPPEVQTLVQENAPTFPPELAKLERGEQEFLTKVSAHFSELSNLPVGELKTAQTAKDVVVPQSASPKIEPAEKPTVIFEKPTVSPGVSAGVTPIQGQKAQGLQQAVFSMDAAPPNPPTRANVVVGQVIDKEGKIVEAAIIEIKDKEGLPIRALKTNKLGHFMIVTPLSIGTYEILTEKEGLTFEPISIEARGAIIPPMAIKAK